MKKKRKLKWDTGWGVNDESVIDEFIENKTAFEPCDDDSRFGCRACPQIKLFRTAMSAFYHRRLKTEHVKKVGHPKLRELLLTKICMRAARMIK